MTRRMLPMVFLVAVNLVPLAGVLFFGWSLFSILVLYWAENGVVGFFNVLKIAKARRPPSGDSKITFNGRPVTGGSKSLYVLFFIFHYGLFWVVHGVFVIVLFGVYDGTFFEPEPSAASNPFAELDGWGVTIALVSLFVSHWVSFEVNFLGRREYEEVSPDEQMLKPYSRVVVLHGTILGGGFLASYLGEPLAALVVMVVLKIALDLRAHDREHRKDPPTPSTVAV